MNWSTIVIGGITLVSNLLVTAYFYGGLSREVKNHGELIEDASKDRREQWRNINRMREDVGRVKGKLGLNGGYTGD